MADPSPTTRRLSPAMDSFLYAKDEKIHTEAETALPTRRRRRSISPMPTDNPTTFWYLATPYSKYPAGLDAAFELACEEAGRLIRAGVPTFSPIAHTHPIASVCKMDLRNHAIWLPADEPLMRGASGLIMLRAESWELSYGMQFEMEAFQTAGKPVVYMDPGTVPPELVPGK